MSQSAVKYEIVPATLDHAQELAQKMRRDDVAEIWAASYTRPLDALVNAIEGSRDTSFTGLANGRAVAMWGVARASFLTDVGRPWLLASDEFVLHARRFLRLNREFVRKALEEHPVLENWVDVRNKASIRWLRWLGFDILPPELVGPEQRPFHRFKMERPCATQR